MSTDYSAPYGNQQPQTRGTSKLAITGLVLAVITPLIGLIVSIVALRRVKETGKDGRTLALIGIWIAGVLMVFNLIFVLILSAMGESPAGFEDSPRNEGGVSEQYLEGTEITEEDADLNPED